MVNVTWIYEHAHWSTMSINEPISDPSLLPNPCAAWTSQSDVWYPCQEKKKLFLYATLKETRQNYHRNFLKLLMINYFFLCFFHHFVSSPSCWKEKYLLVPPTPPPASSSYSPTKLQQPKTKEDAMKLSNMKENSRTYNINPVTAGL